jgi:GNAT superfamily N-acetyltransferase
MPLVFRPARAEDLPTAQALIVGSINDLTERHGFGPMASVRPPNFQLFSLQDDADGLWVAEDAGEIVGCTFGWVCDDLWFLAELFISPDRQGQGIGNELLKRALDHARTSGATNKALITFTFNRVPQGLYIRHGMFPRLPIYFFNGARDDLTRRLPGAPLRTTPIENTASHLHSLVRIDAVALGISREKHHRYLIGDKATQGVLLHAGDDCVGHAYVADGHVGPLAVTRPDAMGDAFTTALNLAAAGSAAQVSAFLPGVSDAALTIAVAHGMRITFPMVLVSARDFGNWRQYLPRNPGFM